MSANENWYNAHNFYGDLAHLDAATVDEVRAFFHTYYAPNNSVLVVTGDFSPDEVKAWVQKYFGNVPSAKLPGPADLKEPRQEKEKRAGRTDPLANRPALGIAYHAPNRFTRSGMRLDYSTKRSRRVRTHCCMTNWSGRKA
jgi:predicted Zn-dependent peptidase